MNYPKTGFLSAETISRPRRIGRSVAQRLRRAFGRGGVQDETVTDIIREGRRARRGR